MPTIDQILKEAYTHWDDAEVLARTGREIHDRNRLDHARAILGRAVELDPKNHESWTYLAFANLRDYRPEEGMAVLRKGVEASGDDRVRSTLMSFSEDEEEKKALAEALGKSEDPEVRADLEWGKFWQGDASALDTVREIHREHPDDAEVSQTLCWMLLNGKGRGDEIDLRKEGLPLVDARIEADPDRVGDWWMKLQMLSAEGDWDGVVETSAQALERFPDEETVMDFRGRAFREKGDLDRAVLSLNRAIGMKPSFAGARINLGKTYEAMERYDLAEEVFREIRVANPAFPGGPVSLALFLARRERFDEAESLLLEAWPNLPSWYRQGIQRNEDAKILLERDAVKSVIEAETPEGGESRA